MAPHRGTRNVGSMSIYATARHAGGGLRHEVDVNGRHTIVTDEPKSLGGTDTGPAPLELLPTMVASCIATMIALYAQRRSWELRDVIVHVDFDQQASTPACAITIELSAGLSAGQVERLRKVANTCPARKALEGEFRFSERLVEGPRSTVAVGPR